jgi:signal transduction histidine kinase
MPTRLVAAAVGLAGLIALTGVGWGWVRFGPTLDSTAARLEREVRQTVDERSGEVEALARRVAGEGTLIAEAAASRDRLPDLFDRLQTLAEPVDEHGVAVTIYVPDSPALGGYRVLAWSDGPGEKNLAAERLAGPAALFIAPGHAGMRLVFVDPVLSDGRRVAVAVAETVLAVATGTSPLADRRLATSFGPVSVIEQYASAHDELVASHGFVVSSRTGAPLLEVHVSQADLAARRAIFLRRVLAATLLPLLILLGLLALPAMERRQAGRARRAWIRWTAVAAALILLSAAGLLGIGRLAGLPASWLWSVVGAVGLGLAALVPGGLWWRAWHRRAPATAPWRFLVEVVAAGLGLAAAIEGVARLLGRWITPAVLDTGRFVLFPFDADGLLALGAVSLLELAAGWAAASLLATIATRWCLKPWRPGILVALTGWLAPTVVMLLWMPTSLAAQAPWPSIAIAGSGAAFALLAPSVRRTVRHATQATRLLLAFLSVLLPLLVLYPLGAATAERVTRRVIAQDYAPAIARHRQELREELRRAQDEIDRMSSLPNLVTGLPAMDTQAAFLIWSQTGLSHARVISDVEIYASDRTLVSRFALNMPEYVYRTNLQTWQGHNCAWEVFGEEPFGAEGRRMLHASRGICDASGRLLGGLVVHVASDDYEALPFIASPSPYYDLLGGADGTGTAPRLPDLKVAVYGWGYQPLFTSGQIPWPMSQATFDRLYRPGTPFWATIRAPDATYHVYLSQNRIGIYALGYPRQTWMDHAARVAEITALTAMLFVALQVAAVVYTPLARRPTPPLRVLLHEIRTSFYRKLFLFFVAVAVGPVLVSALAFSGYMTSRFRADIENEAASTVTVARRVFEELASVGGRGTEPQADDVMVWIRQVINEDVNLYDGSELSATSQRDLFDSGLLPTRTPATVYRGIALERRPTFLAEDRVGTSQYLVAAAPVAAHGRDSILTVPLAPRQRDIAREIDTINRRALVGAVLVVLFAAILGASLAGRIADPVARLTRATRQIAAGRLDVRVSVDTADEWRRLVDDFNSMAETLGAQRAELARANQLKAWSEMARQVAHEIKNPLTPIQLAAEHLQHVHEDRGRPLGAILDQCVATVLNQVRLLRQIASQFSTFAGEPTLHVEPIAPGDLIESVVAPYRLGLEGRVAFEVDAPAALPLIKADRTLLSRALTNLVENAVQAMPHGGRLSLRAASTGTAIRMDIADTGVGMDAAARDRAFEPYFSTKTGGSGLGLANARRHIELQGGTVAIASEPGKGTVLTLVLPLAEAPRG